MTQEEERLIRPPIDHITSGRIFRPVNAFLFKKMLKVGLLLIFIWIGLFLLFVGFDNPIFLEIVLALSQPLEILVRIGWEMTGTIYTIGAVIFFIVGSVYTFIYIRRIEYSLIAWSGDSMPFVFSRRGIINITKKHLPFRTIVNVRTRQGIFDRLFGIGTVLIETAGGTTGVQPTGLVSLIIQRFSSSSFEERIEGVRFYEELRDFILKEMRAFGISPIGQQRKRRIRRRKQPLTRETLEAFIEIRDVLRERERTGGVEI